MCRPKLNRPRLTSSLATVDQLMSGKDCHQQGAFRVLSSDYLNGSYNTGAFARPVS